jgi:hypothetical protein
MLLSLQMKVREEGREKKGRAEKRVCAVRCASGARASCPRPLGKLSRLAWPLFLPPATPIGSRCGFASGTDEIVRTCSQSGALLGHLTQGHRGDVLRGISVHTLLKATCSRCCHADGDSVRDVTALAASIPLDERMRSRCDCRRVFSRRNDAARCGHGRHGRGVHLDAGQRHGAQRPRYLTGGRWPVAMSAAAG